MHTLIKDEPRRKPASSPSSTTEMAARAHHAAAAVWIAADDAKSANTESRGTETEESFPSAGVAAASACTGDDEASPFEQAVVREMGRDLYYASLAEALLVDPPPAWCCCEDGDRDVVVSGGAPLWSY